MEERNFGGKMEQLKLSRFRLQLHSLISDVKDLRERERYAREQLHFATQKQKQNEEEFGRRVQELEAELASSIDSFRKLERKVNYLQNDNTLLENKQKELNETIQTLLQCKEHFVNAYQESTYQLRRSVEVRDQKLKILSEKLKSHLLLFDSIEKEALSVKQAVETVRHVVSQKEGVVSGLKRKLDKISDVDKLFLEKLSDMEVRLGTYKDELQRKDLIISELKAKLQSEVLNNKDQSEVEDLRRALSKKETVIQNLILEKQVSDSEVKSLGAMVEKIQHAFSDMNEDKKALLPTIENEGRSTILGQKMSRPPDSKPLTTKDSSCMPALGNPSVCAVSMLFNQSDKCTSVKMPDKHAPTCNGEEPACSTTHSVCSGPESNDDAESALINKAKSNCSTMICQLESESSTTQAETSKHPG